MKMISRTTSYRGDLFARFPNGRMASPTAAKGWAEPVAPVPTSLPESGSPTVDSHPPPVDEPTPTDDERRRQFASSVRSVAAYSVGAHPRAPPVCQSDSHAHGSSATDTSG